MPIHDLGYRAWPGDLGAGVSRRKVIAQTGLRLAWKSRWLRRLLVLAWIPTTYFGVGFFGYEQVASDQELFRRAAGFLGWFIDSSLLDDVINDPDPAHRRHTVWALFLFGFFRHPQAVLMLLIVGLIAPPLIAQDVRGRAFLLYFSRPVTRIDYLFGKMNVVFGYVLLITTVPALVLYVVGVLLSPELAVVKYTWDLPLRIVAASAVLMIPTACLALAFSSLTSKTFHAAFTWFAVWALGWVAYGIITASVPTDSPIAESAHLFSLYHTLGKVQSWVFGLETGPSEILPAGALLIGLTVVSLMVLFRRISSPMRV